MTVGLPGLLGSTVPVVGDSQLSVPIEHTFARSDVLNPKPTVSELQLVVFPDAEMFELPSIEPPTQRPLLRPPQQSEYQLGGGGGTSLEGEGEGAGGTKGTGGAGLLGSAGLLGGSGVGGLNNEKVQEEDKSTGERM